MAWNFDISQAPRGELVERMHVARGKDVKVSGWHSPRIIAAGNGGVVTVSKWLPSEERWEMFAKDVPPLAWMPWPKHPYEETAP